MDSVNSVKIHKKTGQLENKRKEKKDLEDRKKRCIESIELNKEILDQEKEKWKTEMRKVERKIQELQDKMRSLERKQSALERDLYGAKENLKQNRGDISYEIRVEKLEEAIWTKKEEISRVSDEIDKEDYRVYNIREKIGSTPTEQVAKARLNDDQKEKQEIECKIVTVDHEIRILENEISQLNRDIAQPRTSVSDFSISAGRGNVRSDSLWSDRVSDESRNSGQNRGRREDSGVCVMV